MVPKEFPARWLLAQMQAVFLKLVVTMCSVDMPRPVVGQCGAGEGLDRLS